MESMTATEPATNSPKKIPSPPQEVATINISSLTSIIAEQLKQNKENIATLVVTAEKQITQDHPEHSQHIRFNLIRHHGTSCTNTTLEQFRSFASTLKRADPTVTFLPFQASKQHYSALHNVKQMLEIEENRMYQYFKLYYNKQSYSLSGYFHISPNLSLDKI
jgi:aconitase A